MEHSLSVEVSRQPNASDIVSSVSSDRVLVNR